MFKETANKLIVSEDQNNISTHRLKNGKVHNKSVRWREATSIANSGYINRSTWIAFVVFEI